MCDIVFEDDNWFISLIFLLWRIVGTGLYGTKACQSLTLQFMKGWREHIPGHQHWSISMHQQWRDTRFHTTKDLNQSAVLVICKSSDGSESCESTEEYKRESVPSWINQDFYIWVQSLLYEVYHIHMITFPLLPQPNTPWLLFTWQKQALKTSALCFLFLWAIMNLVALSNNHSFLCDESNIDRVENNWFD